ncbi:unnamed protein product [Lathyrus oleraceus]
MSRSVNAKRAYERWIQEFERVYRNNDEKEDTVEIFSENLKCIEKLNRDGNSSYILGLNQFLDLSGKEFASKYSYFVMKEEFFEDMFNDSKVPAPPILSPKSEIRTSVD